MIALTETKPKDLWFWFIYILFLMEYFQNSFKVGPVIRHETVFLIQTFNFFKSD